MNPLRRSIIKASDAPQPGDDADSDVATVLRPAAADGAPSSGSKLVLHHQGDDIAAIEVTCPCGHTTIIECEYEGAATS